MPRSLSRQVVLSLSSSYAACYYLFARNIAVSRRDKRSRARRKRGSSVRIFHFETVVRRKKRWKPPWSIQQVVRALVPSKGNVELFLVRGSMAHWNQKIYFCKQTNPGFYRHIDLTVAARPGVHCLTLTLSSSTCAFDKQGDVPFLILALFSSSAILPAVCPPYPRQASKTKKQCNLTKNKSAGWQASLHQVIVS